MAYGVMTAIPLSPAEHENYIANQLAEFDRDLQRRRAKLIACFGASSPCCGPYRKILLLLVPSSGTKQLRPTIRPLAHQASVAGGAGGASLSP